jgi:ERCC4-type nuclease
MKIIIDTREQAPLKFRKSKKIDGIITKKLDTGDYSVEGYEDKIAIERKSPEDFLGTMGRGNKRFQKELKRAMRLDYFAIVIEAPYTVLRDKMFEGGRYSKMRPDVALKIMWTLIHKYRIQVFFCNGSAEASAIVRGALTSYVDYDSKETKCMIQCPEMASEVMAWKKKLNVRRK